MRSHGMGAFRSKIPAKGARPHREFATVISFDSGKRAKRCFGRDHGRGMIAIRIEKLTKRFGTTVALHGLDLTIEPGELFFLLGPSGLRQDDAAAEHGGVLHSR
jgi:hypothetical protein